MSETGVAVLGAGLPKISILNIFWRDPRRFKSMHVQDTAAECRLSRICSCWHRWVCSADFQLAGMHLSGESGAIRRTVFGVFRCLSVFVGAFRCFWALFGARARRMVPFLPARSACFGVLQGGATSPQAMVLILERRVRQKHLLCKSNCRIGKACRILHYLGIIYMTFSARC